MHGLNIILHIRLLPKHNPQPLTKRSYKTTLCMCESCQVIFRNNILYREIVHSLKGMSYACTLRMSVSGVRSICFRQHGFKITFHWFGLVSWRIQYKYSQCCALQQ